MALTSIPKKISDTSPASASTAIGDTVGGLSAFDTINVFATLTGATGGVLDVYLQGSSDNGVTWYEVAHFAQIPAAQAARTYKFTFVLDSTITQVGTGTAGSAGTAVIAANTVVPGHPGDMMRAVYVAGASTSAGAAQVINIYGHNARR
jgi:hypothetical protein